MMRRPNFSIIPTLGPFVHEYIAGGIICDRVLQVDATLPLKTVGTGQCLPLGWAWYRNMILNFDLHEAEKCYSV